MTKTEKLKRWRCAKRRCSLTCREIAALMDVTTQTVFNWNCGSQTIPAARVLQLETFE